ncbi:MAG: ribosome small subunit-dependent GTPase A [bacterium]|nr:ribosome small subunit-dependent GTPase A [bacterium]
MLDLSEYGWSESVAERFSALSIEDVYPGRVSRADRGQYLVATEAGIVPCFANQQLDSGGVAVGDWVAVRGDSRTGQLIVGVAERTSAIVRRDPSPGNNRDQVLAANLDSGLIVYRLDHGVRMSILERYMVLIWDSGAVPVIVLSKADLVAGDEVSEAVADVAAAAPGVTVVALSGITGEGLEGLAPFTAAGQTVALVGESGVGKSTLANCLIGSDLLDTGETRSGDGKGRHTTVTRQLVPLGGGAVLIDTPGLRSVGLAESSEGISQVFRDVEKLLDQCRFRDCAHESEPGCAVQGAIEEGSLDARRYDSYLKLEAEQERTRRRKEAIATRAEKKEVARSRQKSARRSREP